VYVRTIAYGFVYDDFQEIVMNPWVHSFRNWREILGNNFWAFAGMVGNYYRPMTSFWLAGNYSLFHSIPGWFHLTSIAAHVLATGLVYLLACRLLNNRWTAVVAAALFGLNPIHVEPVSWISSIPEILMAIFFIAAFLAFERARESGRRSWVYVSAVVYGIGLLSKETAVAFLPVIAVWAWTRSEGQRARGWTWLGQMAPYALVSAIYAGGRIYAIGGMDNPYFPRTWSSVVATWPAAMWVYVRGMLWPFPPQPSYNLDLVSQFSFSTVVLPLMLSVLGIAAVALIVRKKNLALLTVAWIVMPLVPALIGIRVFQWHDYAHDRYTYLSSVMVAIAMAYALQQVSSRLETRRVQVAGAVVLASAFAVTTVISTGVWQDDRTLFTRAYQDAPKNPLTGVDLAQAYAVDARYDDCIALLKTTLKDHPDYWQANYVLGLTYYNLGRFSEAEPYLDLASRTWMRQFEYPNGAQFYYLALAQEHNGHYQAAET
ncbi:MAG: glycosyltransferase family 39 protein, partial [Terriglobales bacterium]